MALRIVLSQKLALNKTFSLAAARSFSNTPLPEGEVLDMSINGLQFSQIGAAIINHFKLGSADPPQQPLGRWKIEVDNFSEGKKYTYDHSV